MTTRILWPATIADQITKRLYRGNNNDSLENTEPYKETRDNHIDHEKKNFRKVNYMLCR